MSERIPEIYKKRQIRSFVLRTGRMTPSQRKAYDELWPIYGLHTSLGLLDLESIFNRQSQVVFEIGFGMGDSLIEMARAQPEKDFIGVEVHTPGVGRVLHQIAEYDLTNIRVFSESPSLSTVLTISPTASSREAIIAL